MNKEEHKKILDDIFEAGESTPEEDMVEQLKECNAILDNIECLLTEIAQVITEHV